MEFISAQQAFYNSKHIKDLLEKEKKDAFQKSLEEFPEKYSDFLDELEGAILNEITGGRTDLNYKVPTNRIGLMANNHFVQLLKTFMEQKGFTIKITQPTQTEIARIKLDWHKDQIEADKLNRVQSLIKNLDNIGEVSDGYHTFNELYHHRAVLFAMICNSHPRKAWKSKLHYTGDMYDDMFIVGINTPYGQVTYHYDIDPYWNLFDVKELKKAPKWDGSTPTVCINRIEQWAQK